MNDDGARTPTPFASIQRRLAQVGGTVPPSLSTMRGMASQQIDRGVQQAGSAAVDTGRDIFKLQVDPNDYFPIRARNRIINYGIDTVADNARRIVDTTSGFMAGIADKVVPETMDRFDPRHAVRAARHPELIDRYVQQRKDQVLQLVDLYNAPATFARKRLASSKNSLLNAKEHVGALDGGPVGAVTHGGRVFAELVQQKAAVTVGAGLVTFGLFNLSGPRRNTNRTFDNMFPKGTLRGAAARFPLTKFMFTKPIARVVGNPRLALPLLAYTALTGIGKRIEDRQTAATTLPGIHQRLIDNNRDMIHAGRHVDLRKATQNQSKRAPIDAAPRK